jgi:DNA-binding response OmpR family regulator
MLCVICSHLDLSIVRMGNAAMKILMIGSAEPGLDDLESALRKRGHEVRRTIIRGLALELASISDFVILDLDLPEMDGYDMCGQIRRYSEVPIVMLTESSDDVDRVVALRIGADDCLSKPFSAREASARVEVVARRRVPASSDRRPPRRCVRVGRLVIDVQARIVEIDGAPVHMTRKEFDLLTMLAENAGVVCQREHIIERVWDEHWFGRPGRLTCTLVHFAVSSVTPVASIRCTASAFA